MVNALSVLRSCYLPLAGIPASTPLHVSENGYPTGPGRTYEQQVSSMQAMIGAVDDYRGKFNVTDYRWFDLRDGDSSDPNFGQQYGILRDDSTPKPAFGTYRGLVWRLGAPGPRWAGAGGGGSARGYRDRSAPRSIIDRRSSRISRRRVVVRGRLGRPRLRSGTVRTAARRPPRSGPVLPAARRPRLSRAVRSAPDRPR